VAQYVESMVSRGYFPSGLTQAEYFARSHIHYGHPEHVVASLRSDRIMPLATEVAPALGWRPAATL
jgi:hypothetical protein